MLTPTLEQTRFLMRYITLSDLPVPVAGPLANITIDGSWVVIAKETDDELLLRITCSGVKAFWSGVRVFGRKAVMGKFAPPAGPQGVA